MRINKYIIRYQVPNIYEGEVFFASIELEMVDEADMVVIFNRIVTTCKDQVTEIKGKPISIKDVVIDSFNLMDISFGN